MANFAFATFLIVCPASFFLGVVFSLFPYDYPLLWSSAPTPSAHFDLLEAHLKLLYHSPPLITRILHIMIFLGILGLILKLYKPSESNMLFDGGSLVLYMVAVIIYITNIVKGLMIVDEGTYGLAAHGIAGLVQMSEDQLDNVDSAGYDVDSGESVLGREDNLKVLSASNTILALVLVGVLVLQAGQWYAERTEEKERKKLRAREEKEKKEKAEGTATSSSAGSGNAVKRQTSGRESKKAR